MEEGGSHDDVPREAVEPEFHHTAIEMGDNQPTDVKRRRQLNQHISIIFRAWLRESSEDTVGRRVIESLVGKLYA